MKFFMALLALCFATVSFAKKQIVSIDASDLSYSGGLYLKNDNGKSPNRDTTTFRFNLNYGQDLADYVGLMWRARIFINRQEVDYGSNNDTLSTSWGGAAGFIYNFDSEKIKDTFFAGAMLGVERETIGYGSEDQSGFNIFTDLEFGKRFDLGNYSIANITYAPTLGLSFIRYGGDIRDDLFKSGNEIKFNFLKFDIIF